MNRIFIGVSLRVGETVGVVIDVPCANRKSWPARNVVDTKKFSTSCWHTNNIEAAAGQSES